MTSLYGKQLMQAVVFILESENSQEVNNFMLRIEEIGNEVEVSLLFFFRYCGQFLGAVYLVRLGINLIRTYENLHCNGERYRFCC